MLEENKEIYENIANVVIPNWQHMDKNDLVRTACEVKDYEKDGYVAAIMLKYWSKLNNYYYKCKLVTTPEDIHSWLVTAVMYAINRQPWKDPKMSVYEDKNGPDKVINRIIESKRLTFYQQLNRYKRKLNSAIISLDTLTDEFKDIFMPTYTDDYLFEISELVLKYFNKQEYMTAFIIDGIIYEDVLRNDSYVKNISLHLRKLDNKFCNDFAKRYSIPVEKVIEGSKYVVNLSTNNMKRKIEYNMIRLKDISKEGK